MSRRRTGPTPADRGAALPMVLGFATFGGLVTLSLLSFVTTALRSTTALQHERDRYYAASAAIDTHIEYLRQNPGFGTASEPCPTSSIELNGVRVGVSCTNTGGTYFGRDLLLTAEIDGIRMLEADVLIESWTDRRAYVNGWSYGPR